jgi:hypothetical protein
MSKRVYEKDELKGEVSKKMRLELLGWYKGGCRIRRWASGVLRNKEALPCPLCLFLACFALRSLDYRRRISMSRISVFSKPRHEVDVDVLSLTPTGARSVNQMSAIATPLPDFGTSRVE